MERKQKKVRFANLFTQQKESTASIAEKIAKILGEDTMSKSQENTLRTQRLMTYYRCAMMEVETKFRVLDEQFSMQQERNPIEIIKTRLKSAESIREKLTRRGHEVNLESIESELYDVAGVRVICSFIDDIYLLSDALLRQDDVRLIQMKDYIKSPKENGYRSLHLIIEIPIFLQDEKKYMKVEVQLRTIAMEFWANLEHKLRYKKHLSEETIRLTAEDLNHCAEMSAMLDQKMQQIRNQIDSE